MRHSVLEQTRAQEPYGLCKQWPTFYAGTSPHLLRTCQIGFNAHRCSKTVDRMFSTETVPPCRRSLLLQHQLPRAARGTKRAAPSGAWCPQDGGWPRNTQVEVGTCGHTGQDNDQPISKVRRCYACIQPHGADQVMVSDDMQLSPVSPSGKS